LIDYSSDSFLLMHHAKLGMQSQNWGAMQLHRCSSMEPPLSLCVTVIMWRHVTYMRYRCRWLVRTTYDTTYV